MSGSPLAWWGSKPWRRAGVACTGYSGEDYAIPGRNALVLETDDPQEFLSLFRVLRTSPCQERAIRQAGLVTAQEYQWTKSLRRVLLPRVHSLAIPPFPLSTHRVA